MINSIENCVCCGKYLKTINEQEQLMCLKCDIITYEIMQQQLSEDETTDKPL